MSVKRRECVVCEMPLRFARDESESSPTYPIGYNEVLLDLLRFLGRNLRKNSGAVS